MCFGQAKAICDFLAAILAFFAAGAWFLAARSPVPFITYPSSSDPSAQTAALECYQGFLRGGIWNRRAAILTGLSALCSFFTWLISNVVALVFC